MPPLICICLTGCHPELVLVWIDTNVCLWLCVWEKGRKERWGGRGGWHWCGLVRRGAGKLICWISSEVLIDQWHTWLHTLHSASLKLSVSPLRESVCCCLKHRSIEIKSTTHAHFKRSLQTKRRRSVAEKKTNLVKVFREMCCFNPWHVYDGVSEWYASLGIPIYWMHMPKCKINIERIW